MFSIIDYMKKPNEYKFAELKKEDLFFNHLMCLINEVSNMFEYKNLPDEIRPEYIEFFLNSNGGCGGGKADAEKYVFCVGGRAGEVDPYGIGSYFTGAYPNGEYGEGTLEGIIGKDVAFIQNNQTATPDPYVFKYAEQLTEIDISIDTLIKNSRAGRVPVADTEVAKTAIENAYKKIYAGVPVAIVNSKPLEKMLNANSQSYEMIDFTDANGTERIQHLLKAKDDIYRQFHLIYGHGTTGGFKLAQESVAEVTRDNDIAFIYPNIKLMWRKRGFETFNKLFGTNIEVDFSESWKVTHDEVLNTPDDDENVSRETNDTDAGESGESGESGVDENAEND